MSARTCAALRHRLHCRRSARCHGSGLVASGSVGHCGEQLAWRHPARSLYAVTPDGYWLSHELIVVAVQERSDMHAALSAQAESDKQQFPWMHGMHWVFDVASDPVFVAAPQVASDASLEVPPLLLPLLPLEVDPPPPLGPPEQ
jgi:hypothetical protein